MIIYVCPSHQVEAGKVIPLLMEGRVNFPPVLLLLNALCAFALNLAVFMLIGKTSALTMNIAGVVKDWLLIWFSFSVFQVIFSPFFLFVSCQYVMPPNLCYSLSLPGSCHHAEFGWLHLLLCWSCCLQLPEASKDEEKGKATSGRKALL